MVILLLRSYHNRGTNGTMYFNGIKICDTIELPWKNNQRRVSCIPEGTYTLRKRYTARFGWHCHVDKVPNRDWILIHSFNNALKESLGCIGPVTKIEGEGIGAASRPALNKLMALLEPAFEKRKSIYLIIKKSNNEQLNHSASTKADAKVL